MKKTTTEEFIKKANKVHNNKYDYSKVEYINDRTNVCIICPEHGEFWQKPNNHLNGKGCKKCGIEKRILERRKKKNKFKEDAFKKHGIKYDYSKVEYVNNYTKVCIICPEHGEFWQTPNAHLSGKGCPKCLHRNYKYNTEEFIKAANKVHNSKYDYSKVKYANNKTKVCIICSEHGEFWQTPSAHLQGQGCPICANILNGKNKLMGTEEFIERAKQIHNNKYDYSKSVYVKNNKKVVITCPKHGDFFQTPCKHLMGQGCPICNESHLEIEVKKILKENKISFINKCDSKNFDWLGRQHLDFYLPEYNVAIECQGIQHFEPVEYFGGDYKFYKQILNDKIKKKLCDEHKINLLYVTSKKIKTDIELYNKKNVVVINKITLEKIKNAGN